MEEIIEEEKKPSEKSRIPLFVIATLALIVDSASESGDGGTVFAAILAIIFLSFPFLGGCVIIVLVSAVFAPLSFAMLTKSSSKPISIIGFVYGGLFTAACVATVIRVVLWAVAVA